MKTIAEILDLIQSRTGKTIEDIAAEIGYTRPYLSRAKVEGSKKVELILKEKYVDVLQGKANQSQNIKQPSDLESTLYVLLVKVSELLAKHSGRSALIELELMKKEIQDLKNLKA